MRDPFCTLIKRRRHWSADAPHRDALVLQREGIACHGLALVRAADIRGLDYELSDVTDGPELYAELPHLSPCPPYTPPWPNSIPSSDILLAAVDTHPTRGLYTASFHENACDATITGQSPPQYQQPTENSFYLQPLQASD